MESSYSPEVVIEARRLVVEAPKPAEPVVDGTTGGNETGGSTGDTDGTETGDGSGGEPEEAPELAAEGTKAPGPGEGKTAEPAVPAAPAKAAPTNKSLRKAAADKLKRCGTNGEIKITATYVLQDGSLFQPKPNVSGEAGKDPAVKACADKIAKRLRLLPRKDPSSFEPLVVQI